MLQSKKFLTPNTYINGPQVHQFQKNLEEYLDVKHVIPCANGTDALQIAMMGLDLKPGDEVITADFTFAATVEVIALLQLTPVFVDVNMVNMNISIEAIKKAITQKPRPLYQYICLVVLLIWMRLWRLLKNTICMLLKIMHKPLEPIILLLTEQKRKQERLVTLGRLRFSPSKNLGCYGDGGAIFTNDDVLGSQN